MTARRDLDQLPGEFEGLVPVPHKPEHTLRPESARDEIPPWRRPGVVRPDDQT